MQGLCPEGGATSLTDHLGPGRVSLGLFTWIVSRFEEFEVVTVGFDHFSPKTSKYLQSMLLMRKSTDYTRETERRGAGQTGVCTEKGGVCVCAHVHYKKGKKEQNCTYNYCG